MMSFPVAADDFWNLLPISELTFDCPPVVQMARSSGGQAWSVETGDALFTGSIMLAKMQHGERMALEPLLDVLRGGGRTFFAWDRRQPGPAADPRGQVLGAAVPTIASLPSAREMALAGLPAFYQLGRGDYLAHDCADGARWLGKVVDARVEADAAGVTPAFEVTPPLPQGAVIGATVSLVAAACKAMFIPDSVQKGLSQKTVTEGATFRFIQTLL